MLWLKNTKHSSKKVEQHSKFTLTIPSGIGEHPGILEEMDKLIEKWSPLVVD